LIESHKAWQTRPFRAILLSHLFNKLTPFCCRGYWQIRIKQMISFLKTHLILIEKHILTNLVDDYFFFLLRMR
jgi:hypothetical protein